MSSPTPRRRESTLPVYRSEDTPADYAELRLRCKALCTLPLAMRAKPAAGIVADALALNEALGELIGEALMLSGLDPVPPKVKP